jgi:hypothetical protein
MYQLLAFKLPNNDKISSKILESDNILLTNHTPMLSKLYDIPEHC